MGPDKSPGVNHYVFSNSLNSVATGFTLIKGDIKSEVLKLKQLPGKDIALFGGASLLASLLEANVVDEISIAVIPVLLGRGKPMVDILSKHIWLSLIKTYTYSNGTVQLTYGIKQ